MDVRVAIKWGFTRWALGLALLTVSGMGLVGCGKDLSPAAPQAPVYTRESPPPSVRSADVSASDFLATPVWYNVASGTVYKTKSKVIAGSHYSLNFAPTSLLVSSLAVTIQEQNAGLIDFKLGPSTAQFSTPVSLTISYAGTNADPSSASYTPGALTFFHLDPASNIWVQIAGTDNTSLKQYTISLKSFSPLTQSATSGPVGEFTLAKVPPPGTGDW